MTDIYKLEKYNFCKFSGMNLQSNYCAILPDILIHGVEERDSSRYIRTYLVDIEGQIKDYVAFVLYIPNKHILAGLPPESVIGTFFRRLIILLDYFKNVDSIIVFHPNKSYREINNPILEDVLDAFYGVLIEFTKISHQRIEESEILLHKQISLERIIKRGRIERYRTENFDTREKVKGILSRIKRIILTFSECDERLKKHFEMATSVARTKRDELYNNQPNFKVHPNVKFKKPSDLSFYNLDDVDNVTTLYKKLESILYHNGIMCKDQSDFHRIQLPFKMRCSLIYKNEESKIDETRKFLNELGIDPLPFERTRFYNNIREIFENYIAILCESIATNRLSITNVLPLVQISKDLDINKVQLGWIYVHVYLKEINEGRLELSVLNDLRSIDLHDGFPYNLYYCIELAETLVKGINSRLHELDINKEIILKRIYFDILSLHAYADNLPEKKILKESL